jgi:hypothetical protein
MWEQPDDDFLPAAEEAIAALRALPGQDSPRPREYPVPIVAFSRD